MPISLASSPSIISTASRRIVAAVQDLAGARSLEEIVDIVKHAARSISSADGATFVLRDGDQCYYVDEDAIAPLWKGRRFPMQICISGWAMHHGQSVVIPDIELDTRIPHDVYRQTFVKSLAMVPIRTRQPIGAIGIYWQEPRTPSVATVRSLQALADSASLAIEHVQTLEQLEETTYDKQLLREENRLLRSSSAPHRGTVRLCFLTKQVEVDGVWMPLETFFDQKLGLDITHGLSPEGLAQLSNDEVVASS